MEIEGAELLPQLQRSEQALLVDVRPRLTLGDLAGYKIDTGNVHASKALSMALRD